MTLPTILQLADRLKLKDEEEHKGDSDTPRKRLLNYCAALDEHAPLSPAMLEHLKEKGREFQERGHDKVRGGWKI